MSADIISLCERRAAMAETPEVDLGIIVDLAIRDLREIQSFWGTELAWDRLQECQRMLALALQGELPPVA